MQESQKMKQKKIILTKSGGVDALELIEAKIPVPRANEILIRVERAGVAYADIMMRHGIYPGAPKYPFTPGYDIAGYIEKTGESVKEFKLGERVVALTQFGGYAQYVCVDKNIPIKIPDKMDLDAAVSLVLNYITAFQMIHSTARLKKGDTVLIHSAAGGVGTAFLQLGKVMGLKIYGTASAMKHTIVEKYGFAIDYKNEDFVQRIKELEPEGLDAVFDPIGGDNWERSLKTLKKDGQLIGFGGLSMFNRDRLIGNHLTVISTKENFIFYRVPVNNHEQLKENYTKLLKLYEEKLIDPIVGKILALEEVRTAHKLLSEGRIIGKIILNCS